MSTRAIASLVGTRATSSRAMRRRRAVDSGRPPPVLRKFEKRASTARVTATTATADDADDSETFGDAIVSESVEEN